MDVLKYEVPISFVCWTSAVFYAIYGVIKSCKAFDNYDDVYDDFRRGWLVKSVKKDAADYEWETTLRILLEIYPWFLAHIIISEYLRQTYFKVLPYWQTLAGVLCISYSTGILGAGIILAQPIIFECFHKFKSKFAIWICGGIWLAIISCVKSLNVAKGHIQLIGVNETEHYMIIVTACWINLRCLSYYLENINSTEHNVIYLLSFCFYLPTLFLGPFVLFSNFEMSQKPYNQTDLKVRVKRLSYSIIRFGFWFLTTELALHYIYVNALSYQPQMVKSLDNWSLYGYGYCMGQFFHLKYVVLYGLSTSLSKFEHIPTPLIPKCIGRIHLYSDMWKYFDEGLYNFLVRYVYLPTLNGTAIWHKVFSSFLCFSFIFMWHGIYQHIFVWTTLNFLGIFIENIFAYIWSNLEHKFTQFNLRWKQILFCIIASPLLTMSAISNFYFFAGMQIGNIFIERILYSSVAANAILLFFLCCCCYVSMEIKKWEQKHSVRKTKSI